MKRILSLFLIIVLTLSIAPSIHANAAASKVKISSKSAVVVEGDYLYLSMKGTKQKVIWTSSNSNIATVSKKGKVTTNSTGRVTITAKIGKKKYSCKVVIIPNIDPNYKTDKDREYEIAEREYIDNFASDTVAITDTPDIAEESRVEDDAALQERISAMSRYGFGSSEDLETSIGKSYMEFCNSWVSEFELKNTYKISAVRNWPKNQIYLMQEFDNKIIIENTPDKFVSGEIYSGSGLQYQYLEKFEYEGESYIENQFYFNREDLITAGVIK